MLVYPMSVVAPEELCPCSPNECDVECFVEEAIEWVQQKCVGRELGQWLSGLGWRCSL